MSNLSEIEVLKELAKGNSIIFAHVVKTYQKRLFHFSFHYLNNSEMAKDVVQDVFAAIWENHEKLERVRAATQNPVESLRYE